MTNIFKVWPESYMWTKQSLPESPANPRDLLKAKITSQVGKYVNKNNYIKTAIHHETYFSQICFSLIIVNNSC